MNIQELNQTHATSAFQQATETVESLPLETQDALITVIQNHLREKRRSLLVSSVKESEAEYKSGNVKRGTAADLMAELKVIYPIGMLAL
jgi:hypothetical protein